MATYDILDTPLGPLFVGASEAGVHLVKFLDQRDSPASLVAELERAAAEPATPTGAPTEDPATPGAPASEEAVRQLREYFAGHRSDFDLPLSPSGTPFQLAVWRALRAIPSGETTSYGAIAEAIGRPTAVRAVGAANGRNPISIIVPCHRVIGANGTLTGYGGGLPRKAWLLNHETSERSLLGAAAHPSTPSR